MHRNKTYIFLDIEAALINGKQHIIELGAIKWSKDDSTYETFEQLIKPNKFKRLNRHIQQLTGITTEELLKAPSFLTVIQQFMEWCSDEKVLVTFGEFDRKVLEDEFTRHHLNTDFLFPLVDYQQKYMIDHQLKNQPSLNSLMDSLNLKSDQQHRALADAYSLLKIFDETNGFQLIENQKTNEFSILLCDMIQKESVYELNVTNITGQVLSKYIEINDIKTVSRGLLYTLKEVERISDDGETAIVQVHEIHPNQEIQLFLKEILQKLQNKVLMTRTGLKNISKIVRMHGCVIPKTETMTLKNLIIDEDELSLFKWNDTHIPNYEMNLIQLIEKNQTVIIEEFKKRNLLKNEVWI